MIVTIPAALIPPQTAKDCIICWEPGAEVTHNEQGEHATHRKCLRAWCVSKIPLATTLAECPTCRTILDVRPLFRPNSLGDFIHIVRLFASRIRDPVLAIALPHWNSMTFRLINLLMLKCMVRLPLERALRAAQVIDKYHIRTVADNCNFVVTLGLVLGFFLKIMLKTGMAGSLDDVHSLCIGWVVQLALCASRFENDFITGFVPPLVTAIFALSRAIIPK